MRKILLLPAMLMAFSAGAFYESFNSELVTGTSVPGVGGLFPHFNPNGGNGVTVPTTNLRLISKAYHVYKDGGFVAQDSSIYLYGSGRGSVPNADDINNDDHVLFDISATYKFNPSVWGYERSRMREQYYTEKNQVKQLIYKNWHVPSNDWKNSERYTYSYDGAGKMEKSVLQMWYGTLWTNDINSTLSYDVNKNVINMHALTYQVQFVYDGNNNLLKMEDKVYANGIWSNNERKTYLYNSNDLSEYIIEKWNAGSWVFAERWTYSYDSKGNVLQTTEYTWNGAWQPAHQQDYVYDGQNNMLEEVDKVWNPSTSAFENSRREVRTYNYKALPQTVVTYSWNGTWVHTAGNIQINFYYQEYEPSTIKTVVSGAGIEVYPVPAREQLNIKMTWEIPEDFTVSLLDMSGRVVLQQEEQATRNYDSKLMINDLPAGNYAVMINSSNVHMMRKIVVAD